MLKRVESREALNDKVFEIRKRVEAMLKEKEALCEEWETKCYEAEAEVVTCEDLIFFYDTPEMSKRLEKAYNKVRHYNYIYRKVANECEELEKALNGLERAEYWL